MVVKLRSCKEVRWAMARVRRNILKSLLGTGLILTLAPFLSWGRFLYRETGERRIRQKVANIREIPPNSDITFPFPRTNDPKIDSDPFRQYTLIHLPEGELKAFSKVCVHLWCLWGYFPDRRQMQCPCHGSVYNPDSGVAIAGPAALQPYPNNALPELKVEVDENGDIYVSQPDGTVGVGREWKKYLVPIQQLAASSPNQETVAYAPLWKNLEPDEVKSLIGGYGVKLETAYGFRKKGRNTSFLTVSETNLNDVDAVYAIEVRGRPGELVKLAEDDRVIIAMLRS